MEVRVHNQHVGHAAWNCEVELLFRMQT